MDKAEYGLAAEIAEQVEITTLLDIIDVIDDPALIYHASPLRE
ncbi:hypothetical protein N7540_000689 [Penicillium herquei]|nr:hypothetical protein N7540_000689 [Penicillium herquei]